MKTHIFVTLSFILVWTGVTIAGTGGPNDGREILLLFISFLMIVLAVLYALDYIKKNGRNLIKKASLSLKKMIVSLKNQFQKWVSKYFDLSYF